MEEATKGRRWFGDRIGKMYLPSSIVQTLLFLIIAFTSVFATAELAARESLLSAITGYITSLKAEFVERNRDPGALRSLQREMGDNSTHDYILERKKLLEDISVAELLKRKLQTLIALGTDNR